MIIAISGKKFSGKSTISEMLSVELGWETTSFAKKLKEITCILNGCTMEQLEDYDFKENTLVPEYLWGFCAGNKKPTYRNFLQSFGTNVMRRYYNNVWVDATLQCAPEDVIISDCRFTNEASEITNNHGIIITVLRSDIVSDDSHVSETDMNNIRPDVVMRNDGNLDDLRNKVKEFVQDLIEFKIKEEY